MKAGDLDRKVTIQSKTITKSPAGDPDETWSTFAIVWAKVTDLRGREYFSAQLHPTEITTKFLIYHLDGLSETMQVVFDGLTYDIMQIIRLGRREGIEIMARAHRG